MIKIAIADDHQLVREGIKKLVAASADIRIAGEACNLAGAIALLDREAVDMLVLDWCLAESAGDVALAAIRARFPALPVLVLSLHPEEHSAVRSVRAGAAGYICKAAAASEVLEAIRKIACGGRYINARVAELLANDLVSAVPLPQQRLTPRESQVYTLLGSGIAVSKIAQELTLSVSSVNTHRLRIFRKLQLRSNADLVRHAVKHAMPSAPRPADAADARARAGQPKLLR